MRSIRRTEPARLALLLALAGCSTCATPDGPRWVGAGDDTPRNGGVFVFHHEDGVDTLDPQIGYNELATMAVRFCYDGLLDYDHEGELFPQLVERLPEVSADGRVFRFRLKHGVHFHPTEAHPAGRELTAADVSWTMHRLMARDTGSPGFVFFESIHGAREFHAGEAESISGIVVEDDYTLRFELDEPDQTFLNAMAMPFAYPVDREAVEANPEVPARACAGTGPFTLARWERGVQLEFERFEGYHAPYPRPDRSIFVENLDRNVAVMRFINGGIDATHRQNTADFLMLRSQEAWRPYTEEHAMGSTWGLIMNTELAPFDNVHVRRAVAFAIDREGWARARSYRLLPTNQLVPPGIPGYVEDLPDAQRFDLERAREEMRLAGHPDGIDEPVEVLIGTGDVGRIYGELIQQDLAAIGIQVELRALAFGTFLSESGTRGRVQAHIGGWNLDFPDPASFFDPLLHSNSIAEERAQNRAFYSNPELDDVLDRARRETDRAARMALYREAAIIVNRDAPWAFAYNPSSYETWQPYVHGYRPHPVWTQDYRSIWLDTPRQRAATAGDAR